MFRRSKGPVTPNRETRSRNELMATIIRSWQGGVITLEQLMQSFIILGGIGSGKSSTAAKWLLLGVLKHPMQIGMLALCAKPDEAERLIKIATAAGRGKDIIHFKIGAGLVFNYLQWEAASEGGSTLSLVDLLMELCEAVMPNGVAEGGGDSRFFTDATRHTLSNAIDIIRLAGLELTLERLRDVLLSAPKSKKEAADETWMNSSACFATIEKAYANIDKNDPDQMATYNECLNWLTKEYAATSERTRSIIDLCISMAMRAFLVPPLRGLFNGTSNLIPEDILAGAIVIVDIPTQTYFKAGELTQRVWKRCWQNAVLRRSGNNPRPCIIFADECQQFVTRFDASFAATSRGSRAATIYITQTISGLKDKLGDESAVDSLLAGLQNKLFFQNSDIDTNEYASRLLGTRYIDVDTNNVSSNFGQQQDQQQGSMHGGLSTTEQQRRFLEEGEFARLRKGGAPDYVAECIYYQAGNLFTEDGETRPFARLVFDQRS